MKKALLSLLSLIYYASLFAQSEREKKAYAAESAQLQSAIWGQAIAEFKVTHVPADFNKESAVIIARSFSLSRASNGKIKFERDNGIKTKATKFVIFHERVKINDKPALENFSTIEYQKKLNKTTSRLFSKTLNENNTFIGAKVIKPDGKEIVMNTDEEVLIKNEAKDQQGKLAISELQVGDILDYYICKEDITDKEIGNSYADNDNLFLLVEEYPVIYYSLDFQFNKKIKVKTIYANGAQHFKESTNDEGDQQYSLQLRNIHKYESQVWTSALREYPYVEIGSAYDDHLDKVIKDGHIEGPSTMLQAQKTFFEQSFIEYLTDYTTLESTFKDYFKSRKALKSAPLDSTMKVLYAVWKYDTFCSYLSNINDFSGLKYRNAASTVNAIKMTMVLNDLDVNFDVLLVAPRTSNRLDGVFNIQDFDAAIRINSDKPMYMFFDDEVTHFNEIPDRFQGENVIVLHPKRKSRSEYTFKESEETLPVILHTVNTSAEILKVSMDNKNPEKLKIERNVKLNAALRHEDQKELLSVQDMDIGLTSAANGLDLEKRFKKLGVERKFAGIIRSVFEKEQAENTNSFKNEIKSKFDQEPQEVSDCKIINPALDRSNPEFEYQETFELNNLVKKAGDNYLVDVGKLTGGFYKVTDKDRKRNVDIYMPCSRSFKYTINLTIPTGFTAKGIDELASNKTNKTGSFSSSATVNGNILTITISRIYTNNFEKAADWPLLVDILDTASGFDSKKILLERKG